ncbi:NnrU family protein [Celeribacter sp. PS-C1]|uniref:NnrU family protein n=1 Tax=Celeribacter sp. PS-C1 TaxID=2820813 RepID=UPI001CA4AAA9|nr:NnrU family protein [Celeribacter sp. PS-C1]MBW6418985.1 NnrU family protein [Celeribacter sp. PS-C1]
MPLLILGLLIWCGSHLFKRLMPEARAALGDKKGPALVATGNLIGLVLMVVGFRMSETYDLYALPPYLRHVNNTLMIIAVLLFGVGQSKSRLRAKMRHPMLTGVVVWAVAHLLVNSDAASLVLFGGMILWALAEMTLINRSESAPERYQGGSLAGDIRLVVISLVVFGAIAGIHIWLGYNPFPM